MPPRRTRNSNRNNNAQSNSAPENSSNSFHSENEESSQTSSQTTENNEFLITEENQVRLDRLINDGLNDVFQKKIIRINGKNIKYSAILNFFDFVTEFETKPKRSIEFKCFQGDKVYKAKLGESGNLKKHLEKRHKNLDNWQKSYLKHINRNSRKWNLDNNLSDLAKYFLTSSTAMKELDNPYLRKMLNFEIPSQQTFKSNILPQLLQNINKSLEEMLNEAKSICLITDLWSNRSNELYLALAVSMVKNDHSKKIRIIGMTPTNGSSNAESIKVCIQRIINAFNFDKRKIFGICCDQGSSLLRLFRQNQNDLFDDHIFFAQNENFSRNYSVRNENQEFELIYAFSQIDREIQEVADDEVIFIEEVHVEEDDEEIENNDVELNTSSFTDQLLNSDENPNSNYLDETDSDQINFLNIEIGTNSRTYPIFRKRFNQL
ncbi:zinc finger BED domain-containing 1-like [Brachionus plicatilis]|uniref:Zinc finger BED domain-containing 1-like n=1 Tax=Brachionus plicatilis TaxID=10195 RepID=A0A3M7QF97_BRAPC|nr:zinc finger BED domain-containing 1-like [Brachionus plicatilis]